MKKRLKIIFIAFCISFAAMIALSVFSIGRFKTFTEYSNDVSHVNDVIRTMYRAEVYFKDIDRWERGYILMNDTASLRSISNARTSLFLLLDSLEEMVSDNAVQARNMIDLKENITHRIEFLDKNLAYIETDTSKITSPWYFEGKKHTMLINRQLHSMHRSEKKLLDTQYERQQFYEHLTSSTIKTLLAIFCLVALLLFALLIKQMRAGMMYQEKLHAKIIDLKRSHSELQDIAYSISHDLQEPLRKIQVFSNMLIVRKNNNGDDDDSKSTLERIHGSANRVQSLITDLESLTNLTRVDGHKHLTNLNITADRLLTDMQDAIKEKEAVVRMEELPEINCYEPQLKILFKALLDNAMKFTRDGVKPEIYIGYKISSGEEIADINRALPSQQFHCISISDNGIGFDNKYISNIFKIFRRLHTEESQYVGKGIGLAICQRIMTNHEGYIKGEGVPDKGATFKLFFPVA